MISKSQFNKKYIRWTFFQMIPFIAFTQKFYELDAYQNMQIRMFC